MLCEVPCAVTDVGHSAELVRDVGALASPGNAEALAEALEVLLRRSEDHSARASRVGRERIAEAFPIERLIARTEAILTALDRSNTKALA